MSGPVGMSRILTGWVYVLRPPVDGRSSVTPFVDSPIECFIRVELPRRPILEKQNDLFIPEERS